MLYFIHCVDKPGHAHVRATNREAHLAYLEGVRDRVLVAGPTMTEDGTGMTGSVLIVDCIDRAAADAFTRDDPYGRAGLFEAVIIRPWKKVMAAGA